MSASGAAEHLRVPFRTPFPPLLGLSVVEADRSPPTSPPAPPLTSAPVPPRDRTLRGKLAKILWEGAGVIHAAGRLQKAIDRVAALAAGAGAHPNDDDSQACSEAHGALVISHLLLQAAARREESRGAHSREDFPTADPVWRGSLRVRRDHGDSTLLLRSSPLRTTVPTSPIEGPQLQ